MAYVNYKEGTGVRARADLTANNLPQREGKLSNEQLVKVASYLTKEAEAGHTVYLRPELSMKLADALLEVVNRAHP
jgi:hypothetical protein